MTTPEVKRLVNRLDELAQNVPPPHDLWPGIAQAIEAESQLPALKRRPGWWMPAMGMAAAVALVSIGVFIGQKMGTGTAGSLANTQVGAAQGEASMIPAALRDANYRKQRDALLTEVQNRLKTMPEEERAKVAASLKTLQRSISDIEAALGKDPANALLQELLVSSCQEEMRALTAVRDSGSQET
jgi:hypothetical protein